MSDPTLTGGLPVLRLGDGPPLMVLAGLSVEHTNPRGVERALTRWSLRPLARHFAVHVVNRRPGQARGATMGDLAADYAAAIEKEFHGPVPVLGISTGGSVAQQLAIDHPRLVRRLVLADAACRLSDRGRRAQREYADLVAAGHTRRAMTVMGPMMAATRPGRRLMTTALWLGAGRAPDDARDLLATVAAEDAFDSRADLPRITAPTLVVGGERDAFYSPQIYRETADGIPGARLVLYPGRAHGTGLTHRPAVTEILGFLRSGD